MKLNDGLSDSKACLQIATCRWAHVTFSSKASCVGDKVYIFFATFEVHTLCQASVISDTHNMQA